MNRILMVVGGVVLGLGCGAASAQEQAQASAAASPGSAASASGADSPAPTPAGGGGEEAESTEMWNNRTRLDDWRGSFNLSLWATSISGNVSARGRSASVNETFTEIVQNSSSVFGIDGRLEVGKGIWTGYVEGIYMGVRIDGNPTPAGSMDVKQQIGIVDFGIEARLGHWRRDEQTASLRDLWIDLSAYIGGRYAAVNLKVTPSGGGATSSETRSWVDPLVGAKLGIDIDENWRFILNGDIGGFGVSADVTWQAQLLFAYRFDMWGADASFDFGYRAISESYTHQRATGEFKWDITLYGPILGLTVRF